MYKFSCHFGSGQDVQYRRASVVEGVPTGQISTTRDLWNFYEFASFVFFCCPQRQCGTLLPKFAANSHDSYNTSTLFRPKNAASGSVSWFSMHVFDCLFGWFISPLVVPSEAHHWLKAFRRWMAESPGHFSVLPLAGWEVEDEKADMIHHPIDPGCRRSI